MSAGPTAARRRHRARTAWCFDVEVYGWQTPPRSLDEAPVAMRALVELRRPSDLELAAPGECFDAPAARACGYLVLGTAALVGRPDWWDRSAPIGPPEPRAAPLNYRASVAITGSSWSTASVRTV